MSAWFCNDRSLQLCHGSQEYTTGFGQAVKKVVLKNEGKIRAHKAALRQAAENSRVYTSMHPQSDAWTDADLESVLAYLNS